MTLYIIVVAVSVIAFTLLNFTRLPVYDIPAYYILSSISQGLAALLALVFTAILIIVQVFRRFRAWKIVVSTQNMIVIFCYCTGIILPLFFLRVSVTRLTISISISLAILCVGILVPFIRSLEKIMTGPVALGELEENIIDNVEKGAKGRVRGLVDDLKDIWLSKIDKKDRVGLDETWAIWSNVNTRIRKFKNYKQEIAIIIEICKKLVKVCPKMNEEDREYFESYAINVYNSFHLSFNYEPRVSDDVWDFYIGNCVDIFRLAHEKLLDRFSAELVKRLFIIALKKWQIWQVRDRTVAPVAIIKQMFDVDKTFVKQVFRQRLRGIGDERRQIIEDLISLLECTHHREQHT